MHIWWSICDATSLKAANDAIGTLCRTSDAFPLKSLSKGIFSIFSPLFRIVCRISLTIIGRPRPRFERGTSSSSTILKCVLFIGLFDVQKLFRQSESFSRCILCSSEYFQYFSISYIDAILELRSAQSVSASINDPWLGLRGS